MADLRILLCVAWTSLIQILVSGQSYLGMYLYPKIKLKPLFYQCQESIFMRGGHPFAAIHITENRTFEHACYCEIYPTKGEEIEGINIKVQPVTTTVNEWFSHTNLTEQDWEALGYRGLKFQAKRNYVDFYTADGVLTVDIPVSIEIDAGTTEFMYLWCKNEDFDPSTTSTTTTSTTTTSATTATTTPTTTPTTTITSTTTTTTPTTSTVTTAPTIATTPTTTITTVATTTPTTAATTTTPTTTTTTATTSTAITTVASGTTALPTPQSLTTAASYSTHSIEPPSEDTGQADFPLPTRDLPMTSGTTNALALSDNKNNGDNSGAYFIAGGIVVSLAVIVLIIILAAVVRRRKRRRERSFANIEENTESSNISDDGSNRINNSDSVSQIQGIHATVDTVTYGLAGYNEIQMAHNDVVESNNAPCSSIDRDNHCYIQTKGGLVKSETRQPLTAQKLWQSQETETPPLFPRQLVALPPLHSGQAMSSEGINIRVASRLLPNERPGSSHTKRVWRSWHYADSGESTSTSSSVNDDKSRLIKRRNGKSRNSHPTNPWSDTMPRNFYSNRLQRSFLQSRSSVETASTLSNNSDEKPNIAKWHSLGGFTGLNESGGVPVFYTLPRSYSDRRLWRVLQSSVP